MATYTIKSGDTLANIAAANGTTAAALAKMNGIADPNKIQAGATLNLAGEAPPPSVAPTVPTVAAGITQTPEQRAAAFSAVGVNPSTLPPNNNQPITSSQLAQGTTLPDPSTLASTQPKGDLSSMVSSVAGATLDSTGTAIDGILAKQQADAAAAKAAEQAKVDNVEGQINTIKDSQKTANQDALAATRVKFNEDATIAALTSIQTKIGAAQEALDMGLIYEQDRPVREQLLIGRSASLQKQGLATIGALQATAQVLQGNIDLAESYAKSTMDAINTDNTNALNSLSLLLDLHNNKLITLTADEKDTADKRITALQDQNKQNQLNQTDVFDLIKQFPVAAQSGGVTLLDDRTTALQKMLPKMSADEKVKFDLSVAASKKALSTKDDADGPAVDKQQLLQYKQNGMSYQEAINSFADTLSLDWINSVYREPNTVTNRTPTQSAQDAAYSKYFDENGNLKPNLVSTIDPAHPSAPTITAADGYTIDKDGNAAANPDKQWWEFWK